MYVHWPASWRLLVSSCGFYGRERNLVPTVGGVPPKFDAFQERKGFCYFSGHGDETAFVGLEAAAMDTQILESKTAVGLLVELQNALESSHYRTHCLSQSMYSSAMLLFSYRPSRQRGAHWLRIK